MEQNFHLKSLTLRYFIDGSLGGRLVKVMSNVDLHKELFRYCDCLGNECGFHFSRLETCD